MTDLAPSANDGFARYFLDDTGAPRLWPCAVLYLDVLGVAETSGTDENLRRFERAWRRTFGLYRRGTPAWPVATFSDLIVLAAPMSTAPDVDPAEEDPVSDVVFNAGFLQINLATEGFFARGAIVVGDLHLYDDIVFGPALVEAYRLERSSVVYPRIMLDEGVETHIRDALRYYREPGTNAPQNFELLRDADDRLFVDYLSVGLDDPDDAEPALSMHRDLVRAGLAASAHDSPVWEKHRWAADYHNAVCQRLGYAADASLLVAARDTQRSFSTLV